MSEPFPMSDEDARRLLDKVVQIQRGHNCRRVRLAERLVALDIAASFSHAEHLLDDWTTHPLDGIAALLDRLEVVK